MTDKDRKQEQRLEPTGAEGETTAEGLAQQPERSRRLDMPVPDEMATEDSIIVDLQIRHRDRAEQHLQFQFCGAAIENGEVTWTEIDVQGHDGISLITTIHANPDGTYWAEECRNACGCSRGTLPPERAAALSRCRTPAEIARWWLFEVLGAWRSHLVAGAVSYHVSVEFRRSLLKFESGFELW